MSKLLVGVCYTLIVLFVVVVVSLIIVITTASRRTCSGSLLHQPTNRKTHNVFRAKARNIMPSGSSATGVLYMLTQENGTTDRIGSVNMGDDVPTMEYHPDIDTINDSFPLSAARQVLATNFFGNTRVIVSSTNDAGIWERTSTDPDEWTYRAALSREPSTSYIYIGAVVCGAFIIGTNYTSGHIVAAFVGTNSGSSTPVIVLSGSTSSHVTRAVGGYGEKVVFASNRTDNYYLDWSYFSTTVSGISGQVITLDSSNESLLGAYGTTGRRIVLGSASSGTTVVTAGSRSGADITVMGTLPSYESPLYAIVLPTDSEIAYDATGTIAVTGTDSTVFNWGSNVFDTFGVTPSYIYWVGTNRSGYQIDRSTGVLTKLGDSVTNSSGGYVGAISAGGEDRVAFFSYSSGVNMQVMLWDDPDGFIMNGSSWLAPNPFESSFASGLVPQSGGAGGDPEVVTLDGHQYMLPTDARTYRALDTGGPPATRLVVNIACVVEGDASYHGILWACYGGDHIVSWTYDSDRGPPTLTTGHRSPYVTILKDGHIKFEVKDSHAGRVTLGSTFGRGISIALTKRPHSLSGYLICENNEGHVVADLLDQSGKAICSSGK